MQNANSVRFGRTGRKTHGSVSDLSGSQQHIEITDCQSEPDRSALSVKPSAVFSVPLAYCLCIHSSICCASCSQEGKPSTWWLRPGTSRYSVMEPLFCL